VELNCTCAVCARAGERKGRGRAGGGGERARALNGDRILRKRNATERNATAPEDHAGPQTGLVTRHKN
jgi:hypothetical protein